ncbi:hypothetical protein J505_3556 [Acinetobacter baumannii 1297549]|nr:hypothetical protein J505_3556 [Acinetobacter baumannii 1297549]
MKETFIKQYWKAYGGWVALFRSPYMWIGRVKLEVRHKPPN